MTVSFVTPENRISDNLIRVLGVGKMSKYNLVCGFGEQCDNMYLHSSGPRCGSEQWRNQEFMLGVLMFPSAPLRSRPPNPARGSGGAL